MRAVDYDRFVLNLDHVITITGGHVVPAMWAGPERRVGQDDRRSDGHDRRWEMCRGRRWRLTDRRRMK